MKYIAFSIILSTLLFGEMTNQDFKKPDRAVFDITKETDSTLTKPDEIVEKEARELAAIWGYKSRANLIDNCSTDSHSAVYCPLDMATCDSQWDYQDSVATKTIKSSKTTPNSCSGIQVGAICYQESDNICNAGFSYNVNTNKCDENGYIYYGLTEIAQSRLFTTTSNSGYTGFSEATLFNGNANVSIPAQTAIRIYFQSGDNAKSGKQYNQGDLYVNGVLKNSYPNTYSSIAGTFTMFYSDFIPSNVNISNNVNIEWRNLTSYDPGSQWRKGWVTWSKLTCTDSGLLIYDANGLLSCKKIGITNQVQNNCTNGLVQGSTLIGGNINKCYSPTNVCNNGYSYASGSYSCPAGGILSGTNCVTTTTTVPATFNQSTCKIDYTYYNYQCTSGANAFGKDWQVINAGGVDCGGTGLVDTNNDGIGDSCSQNLSANNCKREKFSCVANTARPCAEIGGSFKCSPYACDSDKKCGYGHCPSDFGLTTGSEVTPLSADPLKYTIKGTICNGPKCDLVDGPYYTRCGKKSCPSGFGIYENAGKCFKDVCPTGTVEIDNKCYKKN